MRFHRVLLLAATLVLPHVGFAGETLTIGAANAVATTDEGAPGAVVSVQLTPESKEAFAAFTTAHAGSVIELRAGGAPILRVRLLDPILGGRVMVSGNFTPEQATALADRINARVAALEVEADPR